MAFNFNQPPYLRLRTLHAERRRPIVFWVGAGLSQPANLPGWAKLKSTLLQQSLEIAATLPEVEGAAKEAELGKAERASSLWDAFQILKKEMGNTEFREAIRNIFSNALEANIPPLYNAIWGLPGVRGMLTLNLDELAARSHKLIRHQEFPHVFNGKDAPEYAHILGNGRPFIGNLHGVMDAQNSWVFTRDDISKLVNTAGYKEFVSFVFGQMTVIFCGISADDRAAGGFLENLTNQGLDLGSHFWITDRSDALTREWAADAGLGIIRYSPETLGDGTTDHTIPLLEMFKDLKAHVSLDEDTVPLIPDVGLINSLPTVEELRAKEVNEIRTLLSGHAKKILNDGVIGSSLIYESFIHDFEPCIHPAWYITKSKPFNKFYNYEVLERISVSPFSTVWRLQGEGGVALALKVLKIENLENGPEIESFRRGIKSLGYLTNAEVPGTAALVNAYEIPTSVVMEYVSGSSLQDLVKDNSFDPWVDGLPIFERICEHLRYGHNLPQGVLHRDVRPSNLMVPNYYWQSDLLAETAPKYEVKLLNYDMSWHAGAKGQTIAGNLEEAGYYAPEHMSPSGDMARTTLIDSYGVGMCLYYTFTKRPPPTAGSKSTDWTSLLNESFRANSRLSWRSAPIRLRRLIERATSSQAEDRPMIDQIGSELRLIREAVSGNSSDLSAEFWAEELICRSEDASYLSINGGTGFMREPRAGRIIMLEGDIRNNKVILNFKNQAMVYTNRSGVDRIWSEKLQQAKEILKSGGWNVRGETRYGNMEILLAAEVTIADLRAGFDRILRGLERGLSQIRLE